MAMEGAAEKEAANGTAKPDSGEKAGAKAGVEDERGAIGETVGSSEPKPADAAGGDAGPSPSKTRTNAATDGGGGGTKRKRDCSSSAIDLTTDTPEKDTSLLGNNALGVETMPNQRQQQLALLAAAHRARKDSLRLSASRIAALSGFNPYADLPKLILDLVYQGYAGQVLLSQDATLLGLELVSREAAMEELLSKAASSATEVAKTAKEKAEAKEIKAAVEQISKIQRGEADPPRTVASATKMKTQTLAKINEAQKKLPKMSKTKLSSGEVKMLNESIRSVVDTNFGTHHENEALDLYERRYGCEVRERNEGVYCWDFVRGGEDTCNVHATSTTEPTVIPLGLAKKLHDNNTSDDGDATSNNGGESNLPQSCCVDLSQHVGGDTAEEKKVASNERSGDIEDSKPSAKEPMKQFPRPFFSILGSIDGIRDELCYLPSAPATPEGVGSDRPESEEESWALRPIVVECKHRMRRLYNPPPLYDQIQSTVYCLMHATDEADLVQVLRSEKKRKPKKQEETKGGKLAESHPKLTDFGYVAESKFVGDIGASDHAIGGSTLVGKENGNGNDAEARSTSARDCKDEEMPQGCEGDEKLQPSDTNNTELNILVTRIRMDDPTTQHRSNFQSVVLPRLRSIVDAIYRIRSDDDKRYRLLVNVSSSDVDAARKIALEMILRECPWLRHCDISSSWRA